MTQYFHFTLGPVQGFVAQARRTRDFWAGSFILSWLSAVAMLAVRKQEGGEIVFPKPNEAFMSAMTQGGDGPKQGNVPNRFKAAVGANFEPETVEACVRDAWKALAGTVWKNDLARYSGAPTQEIWDRQIAGFWDIQWVLEDGDDAHALDRLKNWRTHMPPAEGGVKCMMMDGWQELSGAPGPGRGTGSSDGPAAFWGKLRTEGKKAMASDLRDGEMLCAVAFVKRRFARYFDDSFSADISGLSLKGWKIPKGVPSVHYMAAAPWLAKLLETVNASGDAAQQAMERFHKAAFALTGEYGEWDSNIACVRRVDGTRKTWKALDGTVFFDAMLENYRLWKERSEDAQAALKILRDLRRMVKIDPVSPFYAVLLMDGDQLGANMAKGPKEQQVISDGLKHFGEEVQQEVERHNGFLVYAGGDDVLALLPLEDALACAASLRRIYRRLVRRENVDTSLSAAIEYAHVKMPLGKVLADAHRLLDEVAKEERGRDAIACRVWKPGGLPVEWAMPWKLALDDDCNVIITRLADEFRSRSADETEGGFANKFFYRIRERIEMLNPPKGETSVLDDDSSASLLGAEYLNSGIVRGSGFGMDEARKLTAPLLAQCRVMRRVCDAGTERFEPSGCIEADGALLLRFLAKKGIER